MNLVLEMLKALVKTKPGTVARNFGLWKCIEGKVLVNRMTHYGDTQDLLSDDNINAEIQANEDYKYKMLGIVKRLK